MRLSRSRATFTQLGITKHILISSADILSTSKHSRSFSESSDSVVGVLGGRVVGGGGMILYPKSSGSGGLGQLGGVLRTCGLESAKKCLCLAISEDQQIAVDK